MSNDKAWKDCPSWHELDKHDCYDCTLRDICPKLKTYNRIKEKEKEEK